jgi:hypothetical protein
MSKYLKHVCSDAAVGVSDLPVAQRNRSFLCRLGVFSG